MVNIQQELWIQFDFILQNFSVQKDWEMMGQIDLRTRQNVRRKLPSVNLYTVMVSEEEGINVG